MYLIAVFKSRSYTYAFYNDLLKSKIRCYIVDTPKQNYVSCGISVKFQYEDFAQANNILSKYRQNFVCYLKTNSK